MPLYTISFRPPLPPDRMRLALRNALWQIGLETQTAIRQELEAAGRVDRGLLRNAVTAKEPVISPGRAVQETVVQGPPASYAGPVDQGRRAGAKAPPVAAIRRWLERRRVPIRQKKGESRAQALSRVAFLVSRAIARRGIAAVKAFEKGGAKVRPRVPGILRNHAARAQQR